MRTRHWMLPAFLFGSLVCAGAAANEGQSPNFTQLDSDGDGLLVPEEVAPIGLLDSHFEWVDSNGDGVLDPAEFSAFEGAIGLTPEPERPLPGPFI